MNLLTRSNTRSASTLPQPIKEPQQEEVYLTRAANSLEGLIADDPFIESVNFDTQNAEKDGHRNENGGNTQSNGNSYSGVHDHIDIKEDAGFIIIPSGKVPENWKEAPDMLSFCSLDRSFFFPGEQIQILACLSACKQDTEIITPFKVAAVMNKNGIGKSPEKQNVSRLEEKSSVPQGTSSTVENGQQGEISTTGSVAYCVDAPTGETLLRRENKKIKTEELLQRFENSYYFVRVAGSDECLWSKREAKVASSDSNVIYEEQVAKNSLGSATTLRNNTYACVMTEKGKVDARTCGGLARGDFKCCSLPNGDIVVLLQINVGVQFVKDPTLEILQFEKHTPFKETLEYLDTTNVNHDQCGQLLKWLLPLYSYIPPPGTPMLTGSSSWNSSTRFSSSGHSRSSSMSSLPLNTSPLHAVTTPNEKIVTDPEYWNPSLPEKFMGSSKSTKDGVLSFRGVPLEPERFSVQCGLEGIFRPGRRWRRKIEIIQPIQIDSVSIECNTEDLICILVKNVSPAEGPDVVVFVDAITLVLEDASRSGQPLSIPVSCIEPGNNFLLPNLALRRGEEHSFIVKPSPTFSTQSKFQNGTRPTSGVPAPQWFNSKTEGKESGLLIPTNQYAVMVSCRCNYTESKLIFKQPISWCPRISRDLMISVASDISVQAQESNRGPLPFQVLTLQATNRTSENLTLTVLAPTSVTSPSVVPLSNPFSTTIEQADRLTSKTKKVASHRSHREQRVVESRPASLFTGEQTVSESDVVPNDDAGSTHLWLQSSVPLGHVPPQSTASIKLEVLPLTDGIITLDSLQIKVNEKGITYVPEKSLKIHATSSIATGVL